MPAASRLVAAVALAAAVHALQVPLQKPVQSIDTTPVISPDTDGTYEPDYSKKSLVESQELQDLVDIKNLKKRAEKLYEIAQLSESQYNHPTRVIGSKGHAGTIRYVVDSLLEFGDYYKVWTHNFPVTVGRVYESRLVVGNDVLQSAVPMSQTPATKGKEPVYGAVVLVDNEGCDGADYSDKVKGNIALVKRGTCPFGQKSAGAGRAGAKAVVIYNTEDDELNGSLEDPQPDHVAAFGITRKEGEAIVKKLQDGQTIDAIAYIDATIDTTWTKNVLAQTTKGDADNCVMLGGHSDSVDAGPGINDDGSGSISVLEIAVQLAKFRVNNCVRFAWWSAEEEGLLGSNAYAQSLSKKENKKVRLFMDLDMMASPNYAYQIYNATNAENPTGSEELRDLYAEWYESQGLNYTFTPFDGRSDYVGFIKNGIPAGGFATGAEQLKTDEEVEMFGGKAGIAYDPNYHQLGDDLTNVDETAWLVNTKLIAHSVATYARSFQGFPERADVDSAETSKRQFKYRGSKLVL